MITMESDKIFWHQYIPVYERLVFSTFKHEDIKNVFEFGVLNGASISFLSERFPQADIHGGDVLEQQKEWPTSDKIHYYKIDQGNRQDVFMMFSKLDTRFDLIIDDGSHLPQDQLNCLVESFSWIRSGGFYILEDVHTSFSELKIPGAKVNAAQLLLAIQHFRATKRKIDYAIVGQLLSNSLFSAADMYFLDNSIDDLYLYQRTSLPLKCYRCGKDDYNYATLRCFCGTQLYGDNDSMAFIIKKK